MNLKIVFSFQHVPKIIAFEYDTWIWLKVTPWLDGPAGKENFD